MAEVLKQFDMRGKTCRMSQHRCHNFDHQTLVRSLHFITTIPGWPLWASSNTLSHRLKGTTIQAPLSTNFPFAECSFLTIKYRLFPSLWHCSILIYSLTFQICSCTTEARSTTCVDKAWGVEFSATNLTYSSASEHNFPPGFITPEVRRDKVSAMFSIPRICLTLWNDRAGASTPTDWLLHVGLLS